MDILCNYNFITTFLNLFVFYVIRFMLLCIYYMLRPDQINVLGHGSDRPSFFVNLKKTKLVIVQFWFFCLAISVPQYAVENV